MLFELRSRNLFWKDVGQNPLGSNKTQPQEELLQWQDFRGPYVWDPESKGSPRRCSVEGQELRDVESPLSVWKGTEELKWGIVMTSFIFICLSDCLSIFTRSFWLLQGKQTLEVWEWKQGHHLKGNLAMTQERGNGCLSKGENRRNMEKWWSAWRSLVSMRIKDSEWCNSAWFWCMKSFKRKWILSC